VRPFLKTAFIARPNSARICAAVEALRHQHYTGQQIVTESNTAPATVSRILRRLASSANNASSVWLHM
jgi:hypothetical protein